MSFFSLGAFASPLQIFVSIPPQKWLVDQVGGKLVSTHVLVDRGQEPHNFEPTPKQVAALFRSQLFFTVDMEFERQISRKISPSSTSVQIVDVTRTIHKIPITGQKDGKGNSSLAEGSRHNGLDPHVWLAPANLIIMATEMASSMAAVDPANKSVYELNVETFVAILDRLDKEIQHMLAPYAGSTFYVFHPAFGYFAHAYNLHQEAVEIEGKSPSPRQLYSLISRAKAEKVKVVFVQPQFDRKSAQAIAHAIGGEVVPLDPLAEDVSGNLKIMAEKIQSALNRQ
jgi:zinc transport system substrate-binding protein